MRGEAELIAACLEGAAEGGAQVRAGGGVLLGPGDDAAILRPPPGADLVWTTDEQVEDVHFRRAWGEALGYAALGGKAAGASLSDLAAMGATPLGALLSLRLPLALSAHARELARGVGVQLARAACPLVGGNLSAGDRLGITVEVLGTVPAGRGLRRDAARPGDALFVSGVLGEAALGLRWLEAGGDPQDPAAARPLEALCWPAPRLVLGLRLAGLERVACLDVSDGLARDLGHLARASGVRVEVDPARLPLPESAILPELERLELAWGGGEDYQLVLAGPRAELESIEGLSEIGRVSEGEGVWLGERPAAGGFDPFRGTV